MSLTMEHLTALAALRHFLSTRNTAWKNSVECRRSCQLRQPIDTAVLAYYPQKPTPLQDDEGRAG
jgi:hypothetical protein